MATDAEEALVDFRVYQRNGPTHALIDTNDRGSDALVSPGQGFNARTHGTTVTLDFFRHHIKKNCFTITNSDGWNEV